MTNEEALYELKRKLPAKVFGTELYCKAYDIAIKVLEKQIPKKVELFEDDNCCGEIRYRCPSCKHNFSMEEFELVINYCDCGQALDWSE